MPSESELRTNLPGPIANPVDLWKTSLTPKTTELLGNLARGCRGHGLSRPQASLWNRCTDFVLDPQNAFLINRTVFRVGLNKNGSQMRDKGMPGLIYNRRPGATKKFFATAPLIPHLNQ